MQDQDEDMYGDGYEDFSDDSGSIPHVHQPVLGSAFAAYGAHVFCR